jgi:hypothetical protein
VAESILLTYQYVHPACSRRHFDVLDCRDLGRSYEEGVERQPGTRGSRGVPLGPSRARRLAATTRGGLTSRKPAQGPQPATVLADPSGLPYSHGLAQGETAT